MHVPVLVDEVVDYLNLKLGGTYIDATLNGGGHARAILKKIGPNGKVLGIEWDESIADSIKKEKTPNLIVVKDSYTNMSNIAKKNGLMKIDGVLFDFGMSSWHLDASGRGFSFAKDEVLDMRYSKGTGMTAAEIVNTYSEDRLSKLFLEYGEERRARLFARALVRARKIARIITTGDLLKACGSVPRFGKKHFATQIFQALRIEVNNELENVTAGLRAAMGLVVPNGRVVAISFHSLEDRIVKQMFNTGGRVLTKKPITAYQQEVALNPRSRSARLRVWESHD